MDREIVFIVVSNVYLGISCDFVVRDVYKLCNDMLQLVAIAN